MKAELLYKKDDGTMEPIEINGDVDLSGIEADINAAYNAANTAANTANNAYTQANSAYNAANSAYTNATAYTDAAINKISIPDTSGFATNAAFNAASTNSSGYVIFTRQNGGTASVQVNGVPVATNATQLSSSAGNVNCPVYFSSGKPVAVSNINAGAPIIATTSNIRIGYSTTATDISMALGTYSATNQGSIAIGYNAVGNGYGLAIGAFPNARSYGIAIGAYANANNNGIAIGSAACTYANTTAAGNNSIAIGTGANAVYNNSIAIGNGVATTAVNQVRIGTGTVGSSTQPVYLNSGVITASTMSVGTGTRPIYMSAGELTASSTTVGNAIVPVYLSSGVFTNTSLGLVTTQGTLRICIYGTARGSSSGQKTLPNASSSYNNSTCPYNKICVGPNAYLYAIAYNGTYEYSSDAWVATPNITNAYAAWWAPAYYNDSLSDTHVAQAAASIRNGYTSSSVILTNGGTGYPVWASDADYICFGSTFYCLAKS